MDDGILDAEMTVAGASLQAGLYHDAGACLDIGTHPSSIHLLSDYYEEEDPLDLGFCLG